MGVTNDEPTESLTGADDGIVLREHLGHELRPFLAGQQFVRWPDRLRGPWEVRVVWADVDGTTVPVGLTVQSYSRAPDGGVLAVRADDRNPDAPAAITRDLFKRLPVAQVLEDLREQAAGWAQMVHAPGVSGPTASDKERADRYAEGLAASRPQPRRRRQRDRPPEFYAEVARLYRDALREGGTPARAPAVYVQDGLTAAGLIDPEHTSREQVRQFIYQARRDGLIPPATRKGSTK